MQLLKKQEKTKKQIIDNLSKKYDISLSTLYEWHRGKTVPWGRKGRIWSQPELAYVIGALLGDGCAYRWKKGYNYVILSGSKKFSQKFAKKLNQCSNIQVKAYPNRTRNHWFVQVNNFELFEMFVKSRENLLSFQYLVSEPKGAIAFIEGFFDAEGCVKIIGKKRRKTPKICLDICNTEKRYLDLIQELFQKHLQITTHYSNQDAYISTDGHPRKKSYHLRIYKKSAVRDFFKNIHTTKLKDGKEKYLEAWLNNGLGS